MARTKISEFSATAGSNTDIDSINLAEGCAPSGINDAIRELMAQLKDFQTGAVGDSFNGPVGSTTAGTGAFTTLAASSTTTLSGLTASTALALDASKNVVSVTNTGTGSNVLATSPTFVTPVLGTPASGTVTNLTGTASININGTVGATTPAAGSFTTLGASGLITSTVADAAAAAKFNGTTGKIRFSPYGDATTGAVIDSTNAAENAYLPLSLFGSSVRLGNGAVAIIDSTGLAVTGTLSATGTIKASDGTNGVFQVGQNTANFIIGGDDYTGIRYKVPTGSYHGFMVNNVLNGYVDAGGVWGKTLTSDGLLDLSAATAGQIKFPATQNASSNANTLDDYEEGTWTPSQGAALTLVGAFSSAGRYTKVGRLTTVNGFVAGATSVAVTAAGAMFGGLPFASNYTGIDISQVGVSIIGNATSGSAISVYNLTGSASTAIAATTSITFTVTYSV